MTDKLTDLHQMLRRALTSQVDLGMGEIILSGKPFAAAPPATEPVLPTTAPIAQAVSVEKALTGKSTSQGITKTESPAAELPAAESPEYESLESHFKAICNCQQCSLGSTRNKFVYGVGNPNADLMFVGEAPGADEDKQGEPFVGRAGQLLDRILAAMQLSRNEVYIANILKCRPPGNRDPQPDEMNKCFHYLREQVRLIQPKLICSLGRISAQAMLETTTPLGKLRGQWHDYMGIPLLVTYHPAALLRFASYKKDTWIDMQKLKARLDELSQ